LASAFAGADDDDDDDDDEADAVAAAGAAWLRVASAVAEAFGGWGEEEQRTGTSKERRSEFGTRSKAAGARAISSFRVIRYYLSLLRASATC
jgi:hypothetical protein